MKARTVKQHVHSLFLLRRDLEYFHEIPVKPNQLPKSAIHQTTFAIQLCIQTLIVRMRKSNLQIDFCSFEFFPDGSALLFVFGEKFFLGYPLFLSFQMKQLLLWRETACAYCTHLATEHHKIFWVSTFYDPAPCFLYLPFSQKLITERSDF